MNVKILLTILIVSLLINGVLSYKIFGAKSVQNTNQEPQSQYPYLSKRIFTESQNDILINFIPLRIAMREYVGEQEDEIGVYFEYLPSGVSIGVNDTLETKLASLIKIPVVMAVYKQMEEGKVRKDEVLTLRAKDIDKRYGEVWKMGAGAKISVEEAVNLTLAKSDNTTANALSFRVGLKTIYNIFDRLDIPRDTNANTWTISPKNYSSILRSLYLSSYLHEENSNEIIEILTKTIFNDKLPAGVPASIKVAHKIGVFDLKDSQDKTYSDCGIVYVPQRPYLLCIMVKAGEEKAQEHMQLISKMVYGYVVSVKGDN